MASVQIIDASRPPALGQARTLIAEYRRSIADVAACSLEHQRFDEELADLPGRYAPPRGRLLVATADGRPAGCVALRPLDELGPEQCEMKRLYVVPNARGLGIGRLLVERLMAEARAEGYRVMKLDTDSDARFRAAIALYRSFGFVECERYNADPDPKTLWFEKRL
jgi:ribosomal protein S18 acetylase RimI-like enzyme